MLLFTFETLCDLFGRKLIYVGYFIVCFYLYMYYSWRSNYQVSQGAIKLFNPATLWCLTLFRPWISITICRSLLMFNNLIDSCSYYLNRWLFYYYHYNLCFHNFTQILRTWIWLCFKIKIHFFLLDFHWWKRGF